jgi:hypothetical protein
VRLSGSAGSLGGKERIMVKKNAILNIFIVMVFITLSEAALSNQEIVWVSGSAYSAESTPRQACIESGVVFKDTWYQLAQVNVTILSAVKINDTQFQCRIKAHFAPGYEPVLDTDVVTRQGGRAMDFIMHQLESV